MVEQKGLFLVLLPFFLLTRLYLFTAWCILPALLSNNVYIGLAMNFHLLSYFFQNQSKSVQISASNIHECNLNTQPFIFEGG